MDIGSRRVRDDVDASLSESARTLRTDVLDVVMLHSAAVEILRRGEALGALDEMKRAGRVRFIGASTYGEEAALLAIQDERCDCVQVAYNLLDRRPEARVLPLAAERDVGVVVRSVLLKGVLTQRCSALPPPLEDLRAAALAMLDVAAGCGEDLSSVAYRFVLAHPAVATALVGTSQEAELIAALQSAERGPVESQTLARLKSVECADPLQLDPSTWGF